MNGGTISGFEGIDINGAGFTHGSGTIAAFAGGIVNSGTIATAEQAIEISSVGLFNGAITVVKIGANSSAGANAVELKNVASVTGGIDDAGNWCQADIVGISVVDVTGFSGEPRRTPAG